jgi:hypothetical protein
VLLLTGGHHPRWVNLASAAPATSPQPQPSAQPWRWHTARHSGIGLGDYLIAATALIEGLEIATLNIRHYPMFPGLARPSNLARLVAVGG